MGGGVVLVKIPAEPKLQEDCRIMELSRIYNKPQVQS